MIRLNQILTVSTLTILFAIAFSSCSGGAAPDILTTTTILADVTRNVVGDRFTVQSLVPAGSDPHSYQPVPQDATKINKSKVLIIHGGDYERFLQPLLENAGGKEQLIDVSTGVRLL